MELAPLLMLVSGLAITYLLQQATSDTVNKVHKAKFDNEVKTTLTRIEHRLHTNQQILLGVKGLFVASETVSRKEFHDYISQLELQSNYPGIQSIGFAPILASKDLASHINMIRKEGFPQYRVFPEEEREFYAPIIYVEPFAGRNLRAFGFDTFSSPVRSQAMIQARDSGNASITEKVRLAQETDKNEQAGFIMYLPIYRNGDNIETDVKRRANIIGWINSAFRMNDLMQGIMNEHNNNNNNNNNIYFEIFDGESVAPKTLMFQSFTEKKFLTKPDAEPFQTSHLIKIFGHFWTIKFYSQFKPSKTDIEKINIITLSGGLLSILLSLVVWQLINGRKQALALATKITRELRKSERITKAALAETQQQWRAIDEHAILVITNSEGKITFANDKFCILSGYAMEELIGQNYQILSSEMHPEQFFNDLFATISTGEVWHGEICNHAKQGGLFWLLTTIVPFFAEVGKPISYIAIHADITPLKQAESQLKEALGEKEALLQEVYHRVKNNLQVVSSLMSLQLHNVKNKEMINVLKESINRIKSMALIHENLYQTTNLAHIDFLNYTQNLITHLLYVYAVPQDKIKVEMDIDALAMDADTAIPCGLIINELVSNALKYAFPGDRQGIISITFKVQHDNYLLVISDNGVGFRENLDINASQTLGLQLVSSLSNQLQGMITIDKTNGASVMIRFPPIVA